MSSEFNTKVFYSRLGSFENILKKRNELRLRKADLESPAPTNTSDDPKAKALSRKNKIDLRKVEQDLQETNREANAVEKLASGQKGHKYRTFG